MIFHTPQKKFNMPTIKINNTELEPAKHFNYLGIPINKHTKWDGHVKKIAIKISKASGIIFKLNDVLPYNVLITLYNALILPHLTYGVLAWGYENDIIFKLQKRALRAVTSSRYNAHTGTLFIKMKLLKVKDIHKLRPKSTKKIINFFIVNCQSISTQCSQGSPLIFMITRLEKETPF